MLRIFRKTYKIRLNQCAYLSNVCFQGEMGLCKPIQLNNNISKSEQINQDTHITKLSNGLTIASQNQFGLQCTLGVVIRSAPRYEAKHISGVSHFIEKLGFQSSEEFVDKNAIQDTLDKCGAMSDCQLARDLILYGISGDISAVDSLTNLLSDMILRPKITEEEMEKTRQAVGYENQAMRLIPPPDNLMTDLIHQAAFRNNTLGLPRYTPAENISAIQRSDIVRYMAETFRPENMVLVGVGVDHDQIVDYAKKYFVPKSDFIRNDPVIRNETTSLRLDVSVPQMTGGQMMIEQNLEQYHSPMPEFAHVSLALESCGVSDPQFVTACLMNTLMGGGGSFSAGGPGKGMYSRLYTRVLNQYYWCNSALATNHSYQDTGLFTLTGSASPSDLESLTQVLAKEMRSMGTDIDPSELARAKCQLKSMLLMNLEMRPVVFEDIGRQVLYQGRRHSADHFVAEIDKITNQDVADLVQRMLHSKPAMAAFGRLRALPSLESISKLMVTSDRFVPRIFTIKQ